MKYDKKIKVAMAGFGRYGLILWISASLWFASSESVKAGSDGTVIFTDRTWALSGDTIWFSASWVGDVNTMGNILHIQLENMSNEVVSGVMVTAENGRGSGYIPVPDSMATGVYWLRGYSGHLRNDESSAVLSRLITIFHRFDRDVQLIMVPDQILSVNATGPEDMVKLHLPQKTYNRGDTLAFSVELSETAGQTIRDLTVSAFLDLPVPLNLNHHYQTGVTPALKSPGMSFPPEKNGFLVEGMVRPREGELLPERSLVMLSIPDSIPYFDYYVSDSGGYFQFMLTEAYGTAEIFIRAVSDTGQELFTDLTKGLLTGSETTPLAERQLNQEEMAAMNNMLESAWFERIFGGESEWKEPEFRKVHPFGQAFYGEPYQRIYPAEFYDLPDFTEISRELLPGVRLRQKDGLFNIQMLNLDERYYFENGPLRLINGIPVFDNDLLHGFDSNDIRYIDIILQERVFGDISFKGVLAIFLNEGNEKWIQGQSTLGRYLISCLQLTKTNRYTKFKPVESHDYLPDFRRVFLFESLDTSAGNKTFSFPTSDLKGNLVVRIEGVTLNNEPFQVIRKIEVQ
jgi:hypothetical protein